ncbi:MAG: YfhO family protein, partial [Crocinitomicaceae bacterium]
AVNDFFLNNFPMYNKFRDSKMILVVLQVIAPALALIFVDKLLQKEGLIGNKKTWLFGFIGVAAIFILLILSPSLTGSFIKDAEVKQFSDAISSTKDQAQITAINGIKSDLIQTRISIFRSDAIRSFLFFGVAGLLLLVTLRFKVNSKVVFGVLGLLIVADQMNVSKRYLNNEEGDMGYESYEEKTVAGLPYLPEKADTTILEKEKTKIANFNGLNVSFESKMKAYFQRYFGIEDDKNLHSISEFSTLSLNSDYRVLNFNNPFNETSTSYFHKSIGGYHGAKLKRYQELIDFYIGNEIQVVNRLISQAKMQKLRGLDSLKIESQEKAKAIFDTISVSEISIADSTPILNMLNTKYIILDKSKPSIENSQANGNAWFVSKAVIAANANEEMKALKGLNARTLVINSKDHGALIKDLNKNSKTESDKISLTKYGTNTLTYTSDSKSELPAVFSEIWYPEGWNCYIDGKKTDKIFRANYVFRGAIIPAGKHKIEWKFEPSSYNTGSTFSLIGSLLLLLLFTGISVKESNVLKQDA